MNDIKYGITKDMKKEMEILQKKVNSGMIIDIATEILPKMLDVDTDKIVGMELTTGQDIMLLMSACDMLGKRLNSMLIKNYGAVGKDNKKRRKELEEYVHGMFLLGLMDDMKD